MTLHAESAGIGCCPCERASRRQPRSPVTKLEGLRETGLTPGSLPNDEQAHRRRAQTMSPVTSFRQPPAASRCAAGQPRHARRDRTTEPMRRYLKEVSLRPPRSSGRIRLKWWLVLNLHHPDGAARPQGTRPRQDLEQRTATDRRSGTITRSQSDKLRRDHRQGRTSASCASTGPCVAAIRRVRSRGSRRSPRRIAQRILIGAALSAIRPRPPPPRSAMRSFRVAQRRMRFRSRRCAWPRRITPSPSISDALAASLNAALAKTERSSPDDDHRLLPRHAGRLCR